MVASSTLIPSVAGADQRAVLAMFYRYSPSPIELAPGDTLVFFNSDPAAGSWEGHSVTHAAPRGEQLFGSPITPPREISEVTGVADLRPGIYPITCLVHGFMTGSLRVRPEQGSAS